MKNGKENEGHKNRIAKPESVIAINVSGVGRKDWMK